MAVPDHLQIRMRMGKTRPAFRKHAQTVGELVWASNWCLSMVYLMYGSLFTPANKNTAVRIWRGTRGDRAQLGLAEHAIRGHKTMKKRKAKALLWAVSKARDLAEKRNDAVHVLYNQQMLKGFGSSTMQPSPWTIAERRYEKLRGMNNITRHFRVVRDDFVRLGDYVMAVWLYSEGTHLEPLPRRPPIRSLSKHYRP
jgi:hypothetical protein